VQKYFTRSLKNFIQLGCKSG